MPTRATPEDIKNARATLGELAAAAGRDPKSIEITVYGEAGDPDTLKRFEDAGADRVIVRLQTTEGDAALADLERMAAQLFSRV
jgi:hypothetical protein